MNGTGRIGSRKRGAFFLLLAGTLLAHDVGVASAQPAPRHGGGRDADAAGADAADSNSGASSADTDTDAASPESTGPVTARPSASNPWSRGVSEADKKKALAQFKRGNHFFEQLQYGKAIGAYKEAVKHWDHPSIRYNMVESYMNLNQPLEAWKSLDRALRFGRGPLSAKLFNRAKMYRKMLKNQLVFLTLVTTQRGVEVTLDGRTVLTERGRVTEVVRPGAHQVVASKKGFITLKKNLRLFSGKRVEEKLKLMSIESAVKTERRWKRYMPWLVFGAGAAVTGVGVGLIMKAKADYDQYNEDFSSECPDGCYWNRVPDGEDGKVVPQRLKNLKSRAKATYISSIVITSAGAAALATGIVLVLMNQPRKVRLETPTQGDNGKGQGERGISSVSVVPVPLAGGGLLSTSLRF